MTDIVDRATRSRMMSGIRNSNTDIEVAVRKGLFARGFRYRLHAGGLPGRPDIVLPRHHAVVFVHGCFWHGHDCSLFKLPGTRREFWQAKLEGNRARDQRNQQALLDDGWRVLTIWECALRGQGEAGLDRVITLAQKWIASGRKSKDIGGAPRSVS